ncbi:hypothetical protein [Brevibacillus choshinensis]|nr:FAD-binding domain-containing protein [Brevibacillus choshinensis]
MPQSLQEQTGCVIGLNYPPPCVDHAQRRKLALSLFRRPRIVI